MDSYDRRRFLADLFHIPPILLGIVSLEEVANQHKGRSTPMQTSGATSMPALDTREYQQALLSLWQQNHVHTAQGAMKDVLTRLDTLYQTLPYVRSQKLAILELLCGYHQFVAGVLRDQRYFDASLEHSDKASRLAKNLKNPELQALVLHRRSFTLQEKGDISAALLAYEDAQQLETFLPRSLRASLMIGAGVVMAEAAQTSQEKREAIRLIDQGGTMVRNGDTEDDPHFLKLNEDRYHLSKGSALIEVGWNKEALDELTQVKSTQKRRQAYNDILQAQAYANRGMFPVAASMAQDALMTVKAINSGVNIARVAAIHTQLQQSTYGNNPEVAKLGYMLRQR